MFAEISAFTIFLAIAAVGFVFLLLSLIFGELFEHFGDGDFGGDGDGDYDHGGPSFFSPRVLSVFVTAFGGFGAVGIYYGLSTPAASGVGFGSGVFFGGIIYMFARFLYGQQASTDVRMTDIVGQQARVVVTIPAGGVGQVRCRVGEEVFDKIARSRNGQGIRENALVRIEENLGDVVIVTEQ